MQRSSSLVNLANGSKPNGLPMWDPLSDTAKKEIARDHLAASLVHLVPVVIILCAVLLWFFSYPVIVPTFLVLGILMAISKQRSGQLNPAGGR